MWRSDGGELGRGKIEVGLASGVVDVAALLVAIKGKERLEAGQQNSSYQRLASLHSQAVTSLCLKTCVTCHPGANFCRLQ